MRSNYAKNTSLSVEETHLEVHRCVVRYGGDRFRYTFDEEHNRGVYTFSVPEAGMISYGVPHYDRIVLFFSAPGTRDLTPQQLRARYRAAAKGIHMRFEQIACGIETPAEAFHAHIILDEVTGETMFDKTKHLLSPPSLTGK